MNLYLIYDTEGNAYAVRASFSFEAENKICRWFGRTIRFSSWGVSNGQLPRNVIWVGHPHGL